MPFFIFAGDFAFVDAISFDVAIRAGCWLCGLKKGGF
jgi:hypothetical protein